MRKVTDADGYVYEAPRGHLPWGPAGRAIAVLLMLAASVALVVTLISDVVHLIDSPGVEIVPDGSESAPIHWGLHVEWFAWLTLFLPSFFALMVLGRSSRRHTPVGRRWMHRLDIFCTSTLAAVPLPIGIWFGLVYISDGHETAGVVCILVGAAAATAILAAFWHHMATSSALSARRFRMLGRLARSAGQGPRGEGQADDGLGVHDGAGGQ